RRIIAAGPAAQGDLRNDNDQHRPGQGAQGGQADVRREAPGQAQGQQEEQAQGGEAAEQVGGHYLRPEFQGHCPHAEQGLANDQRQQAQRQFQGITVAPALFQGKQRQAKNGQPEQPGGIAMDHFSP